MSKNQVEIFESKLLQIINNQNNIYEFINDYINDKSYGTFRIFSKRLKELNIKLFHDNSISEEEYKKIDFVIKNKSKIRNPEVIFNIDAFFKKYIEFFEVNKNDDKNLLNILFLMLPFLYINTFKEIQEIKTEDVSIFDFEKCVIVKYINSLKNQTKTVKIEKFYKEWLYLFYLIKTNTKEEYLFANASSNYTIFNQKLEPYLSGFIKKEASNTKYITLVKNSLKYSKKSIFKIV